MKKKILAITAILALFTQIANASCLQKYERVFFNIKALQSSMMVAALSCDLRSEYNLFMQRYNPILSESGRWVQNYFINKYGYYSYKGPLNRFSTTLANNASTASVNMDYDQYCNESSTYINALNNIEDSDVLYLILGMNRYEDIHQIRICYNYDYYPMN